VVHPKGKHIENGSKWVRVDNQGGKALTLLIYDQNIEHRRQRRILLLLIFLNGSKVAATR
jgi:hypothetical protein